MKIDLKSKWARLLEDSSGAVTVTTAVWLSAAGIALAGLGIDGANLYRVKDALQQSSNRAAVAGAEQLATSLGAATSTATLYSSDTTASGLNSINGVQSVTATVATSCVWSLLPGGPLSAIACPGTGSNVVTVTQTAVVNTFFGFGTKSLTASSSAMANGANGGITGNLDVVFILDSTGSMGQCESGSNGCSPKSITTAVDCTNLPTLPSTTTKMQAAELAVDTLLCSFTPASGTTGTQVALMTFPGVSNPTVEYCGTPSGTAAPVPYSSTTNYQIVPFSTDYKSPATATHLNANSNLVKAMGIGSSCAGIQNKGGEGTYYAGAIAAAQSYLTSSGRSGTQKVILLLSDGDANADPSKAQISPASLATNECGKAVSNASAASAAGTLVFSVAYNSMTTGTCSSPDVSDTYAKNACGAMKAIASDSSKFFAVNGAGSGATCTSNNTSLPTLAATFKAAMGAFTGARLINGNCTTGETCRVP